MKRKYILLAAFVFVVILHFIFNTDNCSAQWVQTNCPYGETINSLAYSGTELFAGTAGGGVFISQNNGESWTAVNNGLTNLYVEALIASGTNIFAGTWGSGVFLSTNSGSSWTAVNNGLASSKYIHCFVFSGTKLFAGTHYFSSGGGIYFSTNNGTNWTYSGLTAHSVKTLAVPGSNLFAGTDSYPFGTGGAWISTDNGTNWSAAGLTNQYVWSITSSGSYLFAGTNGAVYSSINNGTNWTVAANTGLNGQEIKLAVSGAYLFAGTNNGIYLSTNNGASWLSKNQGFTNNPNGPNVWVTLFANNYIFAGTNISVWRRSFADIVGIKQISGLMPSSYSLSQNYPNPFNPSTNLEFGISKLGFVSLKIYDLLGKEVVTLVNEKLNPGKYSVEFDGSSLTSGVYFYRLTTDGFSDTKRMMLLK